MLHSSQVLERLETDLGADLAGQTLQLLFCARSGLADTELSELLVRAGFVPFDAARAVRSVAPLLQVVDSSVDAKALTNGTLRKLVRQRYTTKPLFRNGWRN